MLKKLLGVASLFALVLLSSCGEYKTTESGLRYKIVVDSVEGDGAGLDGAIFFDMSIYRVKPGADDSLINAGPNAILLSSKHKKGSLEEGLLMLGKGDSAIFLINVDSFFTFEGVPKPKDAFLTGTTDLKFVVKVSKTMTPKEVKEMQGQRAEQQKAMMMNQAMQIEEYKRGLFAADSNKAQIKKDEKEIKAYLAKNKITAEHTQNGVYYAITKTGTGAPHAVGDTVTVNYKGTLMNGEMFDSSEGKPPFSFIMGMGQVILGWDEVMPILKVGDKATIYIPSILAYGPQAQGKIPANANLIFEVEIIK